VLIQEMTGRK